MNWSAERALFQTRLSTMFTAAPLQFQGQPFTEPTGSSWVRLEILPAETKRISLGPYGVIRTMGTLVMLIFTPANQGSDAGRALADQLDPVFREWTYADPNAGNITCWDPSVDDRGTTSDGTNYQINLTVPYWRDVQLTS